MILLGVAVGCPKAYVESDQGGWVSIGDWTPQDEANLIKKQTEKMFMWPLVGSENDSSPSCNVGESADLKFTHWLNYTIGSTVQHKRLLTPKHLSWSYWKHANGKVPSNEELARLYHELAIYLPLNNLDVILNRMENVGRTKKFSGCGVSEVSKTFTICQFIKFRMN